MSSIGPYEPLAGRLFYPGGSMFPCVDDVAAIKPKCAARVEDLARDENGRLRALARLFDGVCSTAAGVAERGGALRIDLPVITRMISSPGAIEGTISTDVDPFQVQFFGEARYLTQSSQLYLELALLLPGLEAVYCLEKSFRQELPDYRHLPEFNHIEYETRGDLEGVILHQTRFIREVIEDVLNIREDELKVFGTVDRVERLARSLEPQYLEVIRFREALSILYEATGDPRYKRSKHLVQSMDGYAEVLLTKLLGDRTVAVAMYPEDEVAFYHASGDGNEALNADLLVAGYGEIVGSGQRILSVEALSEKARRLRLNFEDYRPYIESRRFERGRPHVGWGLGIERLLQLLTHQPFIWLCRLFPHLGQCPEI